jgi:hypothetical protein
MSHDSDDRWCEVGGATDGAAELLTVYRRCRIFKGLPVLLLQANLVTHPWLEVRLSSQCREALLTEPSIQQTCLWAISESSHP